MIFKQFKWCKIFRGVVTDVRFDDLIWKKDSIKKKFKNTVFVLNGSWEDAHSQPKSSNFGSRILACVGMASYQ